MLSPAFFIEQLELSGLNFFTGVPDSLLKSVCAYLTDYNKDEHIIAANEGAAMGLAAGYHLATGKIPVVYMQNSGLGNAINPLVSLIDEDVYNMPLLLLIGWRGEPNVKDEPQHIKQGKVTIPLLNALGVKNCIVADNETDFLSQLDIALKYINKNNGVYAFVIKKGIFDQYTLQNKTENNFELGREEAIQLVASFIENDAVIVSTTGMISRELFEYRESVSQCHHQDFLTVGSMGHSSQIALGIALQEKNRKVYCFDGDGALLMHTGSLAIIGAQKPNNFIHFVFNNGAHDSVGGQPTVAFNIDIPAMAKAFGYKKAYSIETKNQLLRLLENKSNFEAPVLIEIKVKRGNRSDLGRPTTTPIQNKENLMNFIIKGEK